MWGLKYGTMYLRVIRRNILGEYVIWGDKADALRESKKVVRSIMERIKESYPEYELEIVRL